MKRMFLTVFLALFSTSVCLAQDDRNKFNFFVGYSNNQVDTAFDDGDGDFDGIDEEVDEFFNNRQSFNGINLSLTGNVSRYVGLKADYSYHQKKFGFGSDVGDLKLKLNNFVGGVQIKDNSNTGRFKPFAHFMVGAARLSADVPDFDDDFFDSDDLSDTGLSGIIGGGIDIRVNDRFSVRAIQLDYNPVRFNFGDSGVAGEETKRTLHNVRFGVGIVFH